MTSWSWAQVRSCRWPGRASEVQIGSPSGRMTAWMLAPKSRCLPEYQTSIVSPFTLVVSSASPSVGNSFPSRITYDQPSATRRRAACRSGASAVRTLIPSATYRYAVARDTSNPAPSSDLSSPLRNQTSTSRAWYQQVSALGSGAGAAGAAFSGQQPGDVPDQFPGHVEDGTIGDHVESSRRRNLVQRPVYRRLHAGTGMVRTGRYACVDQICRYPLPSCR